MACGCKEKLNKSDSGETLVLLSESDFVLYEFSLIVVTVALFAFAVYGFKSYMATKK